MRAPTRPRLSPKSLAFSIDGKSYEIDLSEKHAAGLRDAFAPFVGSARRGGGGSPRSTRLRASARSGRSREETTSIREWANANGYEVATRGRIPSNVLEAYENRRSTPVAPVAAAAVEAPVVKAEVKPRRRARKKAAVES